MRPDNRVGDLEKYKANRKRNYASLVENQKSLLESRESGLSTLKVGLQTASFPNPSNVHHLQSPTSIPPANSTFQNSNPQLSAGNTELSSSTSTSKTSYPNPRHRRRNSSTDSLEMIYKPVSLPINLDSSVPTPTPTPTRASKKQSMCMLTPTNEECLPSQISKKGRGDGISSSRLSTQETPSSCSLKLRRVDSLINIEVSQRDNEWVLEPSGDLKVDPLEVSDINHSVENPIVTTSTHKQDDLTCSVCQRLQPSKERRGNGYFIC